MVGSRGFVIIAGALVVSPLAVAAFRAPSSSVSSSSSAAVVLGRGHTNCSSSSSSRTVSVNRLHASLLSDSDEQTANDILNRAVENSVNGNASNGVVDFTNGVDLNVERHQLQKQMNNSKPKRNNNKKQSQRQINKSRKNNKATSDPEFLRKRTETLLHKTTEKNIQNTLNSINFGSFKVDKKTFDWLIDAWSYSGQDDAAENAQALLSRMEELRELDILSPDVKTYTKVINAIARSGREKAGEQAEAMLERMIEDEAIYGSALHPNTFTYTYVIDAYARSPSPKSPHAAQRLIEKMEQLRMEGDPDVKPTTRAWNSVIAAWSQWKGEEMAWGRVGSGAERAEACLDIMEQWANDTGNEDVRPNSYNYNSVISALANSQDEGAASRAEKILERMETLYRTMGDETVKPRTATYNAIIDAWAKSGEIDAANRAELLLAHMMELYETGHNLDAKPNARSFNSVMNAWAKSGDHQGPERAADVLARMEELDRTTDLDVSPDATSFATAINAYARSHMFGKAQSAYDLYLHMKELHDTTGKIALRPNNVVYNSVLNACAFSVGDLEEQSHAVEIANTMLVGLQRSPYGKPDQVTYGTYLKVINNQMPPSEGRDQVAETVFRKCAKDGMVGQMVLRQLQEMGLDEVYENLAGISMWGEIDLRKLPGEWTCNVIEGKRKRRWQFRR